MDITPFIKSDRKIIQAYSATGFQISHVDYDTAVIVYPDRVDSFAGQISVTDIDEAALASVFENADHLDLVLIGTGQTRHPLSSAIMQRFTSLGVGVEVMDTGAACRTYNVLLTEGRRLAAILFPL